MSILLSTELVSVKPLKDRSYSVTFHTLELDTRGQGADLIDLVNTTGWLMYSNDSITQSNIDEMVKKGHSEFEGKTPSKRLQAVIYLLWQKDKEGDFETYYRLKMEGIINHLKNRLN